MRPMLALLLIGCGARLREPTAVNRIAYPSGKARFEFELRGGIPNGRGRAWYANGKLASDGSYKDGARHGRFWLYNEDGTFAAQAVYVDNAEVWRSVDEGARPPGESSQGIARPATVDATMVVDEPEPAELHRVALRPYFSTLDRTTAPARAGAQLGVSDAKNLDFGSATRLDVFGHYRIDRYGVFAQLSETRLTVDNDMTLAGRRAALLAGTYHRELGPAMLSATGGMIVALGNTDPAGSVASLAGAEQRPADAAGAIPAPFTMRSSGSLTTQRGLFLLQLDAGIDWLLGGDERGFDLLGRANVGVGFGTRSTMLTAELDNSIPLSGLQARLHAVAFGGTVVYRAVWISASLAFSDAGTTSFLGSVGHDL